MARWFRSHAAKLNDPKIQRLTDAQYRAWDSLLCVACEFDGKLAPVADTAFLIRKTEADTETLIGELISLGLFVRTKRGVEPHNWNKWQYKSDVSTNRVKQFRQRRRNVSVTPSESENRDRDSVAKATGARAPARDVIFTECLPWLNRRAGKDCRSLVGKWLSETRDDDAVRQVLEACEQENPVDPIGWIAARFKPRPDKAQEIRDAIARGLNS